MGIDPNTYGLEELRAAPVPTFAEQNTDTIKKDLVAKFESITGRTLYPAQPEMFQIELMAYALSVVGSAVQNGAMQNRSVWAEKGHLNDKGADVSTYRLKAQNARAVVEFTLSEIRATAIIVPVGTRVAAGSSLVFATVSELVIPAGQTTGQVAVAALETGAKFNDLQPGQIQDILDPIAYVASVASTEVTAGGSDEEDEERFRGRVTNAFDRIAGTGSRKFYEEETKAVSPNIVAVHVHRPSPCVTEITPLMVDGVAEDAMDAAILDHLDPEENRPQGDDVFVLKAQPVVFDVAMTLKTVPGMSATAKAGTEDAIRATFGKWSTQLGSQIAPSELEEVARQVPGVVGVTRPAFPFTDLAQTQFAQLGTLTIDTEEAPNV